MNFDPAMWSDRLWPWVRGNWEWLIAAAIILFFAIAVRRILSRAARRPRPAKPAAALPDNPGTQALDLATAAAAEISGDLEAYARALFTEDMTTQANRAVANAPQALRFATIAEAPFIYDGVIMRDVALLPTPLIAPVSGHFRHAQTILDALRRQSLLTADDAAADDRVAALRGVAQALAQGVDKAAHAAEKLDQWLVKNGGAFEPPRGLLDLPGAAFRQIGVERVGQRSKAYRVLREQTQARLAEIDGLIETARRSVVHPTIIALPMKESGKDAPAVAVRREDKIKSDDARAAE